jgi:undecaprenyl-diphosphatase
VVAAVIALVPAGRRTPWALAAALFSILMGLSRAYLGAHWLSDAAAGLLLGTSCALLTALLVSWLQLWRSRRRPRPAGTERTIGVPPPDRAEERR